MKMVDNYVRRRKQVKADRSTEQGIAGHQAAMAALGSGSKSKFITLGDDVPRSGAVSTRDTTNTLKGELEAEENDDRMGSETIEVPRRK